MKGRNVFTSGEAVEIRRLLQRKVEAPSQDQKQFRDRLRKQVGFYISDFDSSRSGFGPDDFDRLIELGKIQIDPGSSHSIKSSRKTRSRSRGGRSDEDYVIDLCDEVLGRPSKRQHRFSFLRGDSGTPLPVDAYYADLKLVVEYRERQHTQSVPHFDKPHKLTVSGVPRGEQRRMYDQRRRDVLPRWGIRLVEIEYSELSSRSSGRLVRDRPADRSVIEHHLRPILGDPLA